MKGSTVALFLAGTAVTFFAVDRAQAKSKRTTLNAADSPWRHTDKFECDPPTSITADDIDGLGFLWVNSPTGKLRTPNRFAEFICQRALWEILAKRVPMDQLLTPGNAPKILDAARDAKEQNLPEIASFLEDLAYALAQKNGAGEKPAPNPGGGSPAPAPGGGGNPTPNPGGGAPPPGSINPTQQIPQLGGIKLPTVDEVLANIPAPYNSQIKAMMVAWGPQVVTNLYTLALNWEQSSDPNLQALATQVRLLARSLEANPNQVY